MADEDDAIQLQVERLLALFPDGDDIDVKLLGAVIETDRTDPRHILTLPNLTGLRRYEAPQLAYPRITSQQPDSKPITTQAEAACVDEITIVPPEPTREPVVAEALHILDESGWQVRKLVPSGLLRKRKPTEICLGVLGHLARNDPEWRVRVQVAEALARHGGAGAISILSYMAKTDPHPSPAETALKALGRVAKEEWPEDLDTDEVKHADRLPFAMRVRGARPSKRVDPEANKVLEMLDDLRYNHSDADVRKVADETLASLDE